MHPRPRLLLALVGASLLAVAAQAQTAGDREKEQFLLESQLVRSRGAPGAASPLRATLRLGGVTHQASVQLIDESSPKRAPGSDEPDSRNSWRNDVAAYRIDRLLGLRMVPVTVIRPYKASRAAFTWWQDDFVTTGEGRREQAPDAEAWTRQLQAAKLFAQLIHSPARGESDLLVDRDFRLWMVDHARAFDAFRGLRNEKELGDACPRGLLAALRKLDEPTLKTRTGGLLTKGQIDGVLERRDRIVTHYDRLIAARGAANVLYDLPARP